jgi:transposase
LQTPTREDLARLDRKREKRTSNKEWMSPIDEDARVAKMKDGSTHLAHKAEHAVDMESGAVVAVTLQAADLGDTTAQCMQDAGRGGNLAVAELVGREAELRLDRGPQSQRRTESKSWWRTRAIAAGRFVEQVEGEPKS